MRKTLKVIWMTLLLFYLSTSAFPQSITLKTNKITIKEAIEKLKQTSGYSFVFEVGDLDTRKTVMLNVTNATIESVVDQIISDQNVTWHINGKNIVIRKQSSDNHLTKKINGTVVDDKGETIIGANVSVKGTTNGTITDLDGNFTLDVETGATLLVTYIGYTTKEITVNSQSTYQIIIAEDTQKLEEVVVIGYGTAKKKDLTGAISSIKAEKISVQAPRNVQDILRANAAGLNIGMATDAKAEADLSIRGKGTLSASSNPLIVLDGVIYEGALADISPEDIANVDILKDASSAAVYGAKSANGVIVISTKRGKDRKPVITFNANFSLAQPANQPKILRENEFLKFRQDYNEGRNSEAYLQKYPQIFTNPFDLNGVSKLDWYNYDQKTPVTTVTDKQLTSQWLSRLNLTIPEIDNYFANNITYWDDLVFQSALQQDYTASFSNGTDHSNQYVSINWADRKGVITGDQFQNFRIRANQESKIASFLTIGLNAQFASRDESYLKSRWDQMTMISPYGSNNIGDPNSVYQRNPTGLDPINPFYDNLYTDRLDRTRTLNAKLFAQVSLPFDLKYEMNFTPYLSYNEYYNHNSSLAENWSSVGGLSTRQNSNQFSWQIDNIVRWKREFAGKHNLEVTFLVNAEQARYWSTTANNRGYSPSDVLGYHALQAGTVPTVSSNDWYQTGDALMGRLYYSFQNKYMITASIRRDGFSAFGKKNPHAVFPAVALGWVFTQEKFLEGTSEWLNYGKLRLSWGENGNRDIGRYVALSQMTSGMRPYIDASGNVFSTSQLYVSTMANHNLKWERTGSYNLGIDFSLFQDILSGSIEGYISQTHDLLVNRTLPNITGFKSVTANLGQVNNKGLEITLNANIIQNKDFNWLASANFSLNRRKIAKLYGDMTDVKDSNGNVIGQRETDDETNGWFIGQDPDRIWSYERSGVWQLREKEEAAIYGCQPGDFKYIDQNGDKVMTRLDNTFQGYKTPRFRWTLRNEFVYKDFSLSAVIYSYWGHYNAFQRAANNYAFPDRTSDYAFPRWTSTNSINDYARIGSKNIGTNWVNRSFIRLENVTIAYNVPQNLIKRIQVQSLRVSASVQNAAVWSPKWNFWDPESGTVTPRTFNLGLNITL